MQGVLTVCEPCTYTCEGLLGAAPHVTLKDVHVSLCSAGTGTDAMTKAESVFRMPGSGVQLFNGQHRGARA